MTNEERATDPSPDSLRPGRYRHYKGKFYTVLGVARHSETEERLVVYRQEYGDGSMWVRPLAMFVETVANGCVIERRFAYVGEETATGD